MWSEIFPKTMRNLKYERGNFPNESLGPGKHFKHVFGWRLGDKLREYGSKLRTSEPRPTFTGSYKIKNERPFFL